jgi:hypothetical protein
VRRFNGIPAGLWALDLLVQAPNTIPTLPNIAQIPKEKILRIEGNLRLH